MPDQRHKLARLGVKRNLAQCRLCLRFVVAERDTLKRHFAAYLVRRKSQRIGCVHNLLLQVEIFEDTVEQRQSAGDIYLDIQQTRQREKETGLQGCERHNRAERQVPITAGDHKITCQPVDQHRGQRECQADQVEKDAEHHRLLDLRLGQTLVLARKLLQRETCPPAGFGQQDTRHRKRLLHRRVHVCEPGLDQRADALPPFAD